MENLQTTNHELATANYFLPARFFHSRNFAAIREFPKTNPAETKIPHICTFPSAPKATAHNARGVFWFFQRARDNRLFSQWCDKQKWTRTGKNYIRSMSHVSYLMFLYASLQETTEKAPLLLQSQRRRLFQLFLSGNPNRRNNSIPSSFFRAVVATVTARPNKNR